MAVPVGRPFRGKKLQALEKKSVTTRIVVYLLDLVMSVMKSTEVGPRSMR